MNPTKKRVQIGWVVNDAIGFKAMYTTGYDEVFRVALEIMRQKGSARQIKKALADRASLLGVSGALFGHFP